MVRNNSYPFQPIHCIDGNFHKIGTLIPFPAESCSPSIAYTGVKGLNYDCSEREKQRIEIDGRETGETEGRDTGGEMQGLR
jgi:hypothetical protein